MADDIDLNSISKQDKVTEQGVDEKAEKTIHGCDMSDDYVGFCKRIRYLFPRSMMASYALVNWRMAFYKAKYPHEFENVMSAWNRKAE